ncbi:riboflavin biosynthesis protein RibF [Nitritalea halalkaliphila LW7]|uniref:Riboflavin biosynthesis protein n=1 Tax=Nitritalea halalkaliphila LW7 TaxID=1189621 RepID=I5C4K8_9BACT|nr:bifunctional riboflavin kinase/FAD synthetase [Nitritalea halalkaliphila]EIM76760.1 riboflavin biosynthesis protein RibF [Nitritalea halalkaliphila LW7]
MQIYEGISSFRPLRKPIVTSGTFDGVHKGHQKILRSIREQADAVGGETVLITYWPHPRLVLYPDDHQLRLLSTFEEKAALLAKNGIDHLLTIPFTREFAQLSPEAYVQRILIDTIGTHKLVIGYDHRFGKDRAGSFAYLRENEARFGFALEEITREDIEDIGISSTKIRQALLRGDVQTAHDYLGAPYELNGIIIKGQQVGRSIGFPTANVHLPHDYKLVPGEGAYAVRIEVEGTEYDGMLNIGRRPTVNGINRSIEVNLFNFTGDLYDRRVRVRLLAFLREERKFDGLEALKEQLEKDRKHAKQLLERK